MREIIVLFCFFYLVTQSIAQDTLESSLPIFKIQTYGQTIVNEPRIAATLGVIYKPGDTIISTDSSNHYYGQISVEFRGSSSQQFPKKSMNFETQNADSSNRNVSLLSMPSDNDWILFASYSDKTLLRNALSYHLYRQMGRYAPRTSHCELLVNDQYMGVYMLTEKVKQGKNRVAITKISETDIGGIEVTGGYIMKIDKFTSTINYSWQSLYPPYLGAWQTVHYQIDFPDQKIIQDQQKTYITNYVKSFEKVMNDSKYNDSILGYSRYIDVSSFIDYCLLNEISKNVDGYRISTFLHKNRNDKDSLIIAGPPWDYDIAWGNANYYNGYTTSGWSIYFSDNFRDDGLHPPFWWKKLWDEKTFNRAVRVRWNELRKTVLDTLNIFHYIDSVATMLDSAQMRNFTKWPIIGSYVWPNYFIGSTYQSEVNYLKTWITSRINWMDTALKVLPPDTPVIEPPIVPISLASLSEDIKIYPNPATDHIVVSMSEANIFSRIEIISMEGKVVRAIHNVESVITIHIDDLPRGIYCLNIFINGQYHLRRFVKQ